MTAESSGIGSITKRVSIPGSLRLFGSWLKKAQAKLRLENSILFPPHVTSTKFSFFSKKISRRRFLERCCILLSIFTIWPPFKEWGASLKESTKKTYSKWQIFMVPFIGCSTIHSLGRLRRIKYPASQVEVGIQTSQQSPIVFILFFHKILPLSLSQFFFRISVNLENRGSITIWLTSCLTCLNSTKQVNMLIIQHKQSSWIQKNKPEVSHTVMCSSYQYIFGPVQWLNRQSSPS